MAVKKKEASASVGKNGRLYFKYGTGAKFEIYDRMQNGERRDLIAYATIILCELSEEEAENYTFMIERADGKGLPKEKSEGLTRFEEYLNMGNAEQIEAGNAVEYPVIRQEAKMYYAAVKRRQPEALKRAEQTLIGEPEKDSKGKIKKDKQGKEIWDGGLEEYRNLLKEQEALEAKIAEKIACGEEIPFALSDPYRKLCLRRKEIIEENGIRYQMFLPVSICQHCNNTGLDEFGAVCVCAKDKTEEIKRYCAKDRIKKQLQESWAISIEPEEEPETDEEEDE